jgi:Zn2+/Cd2+-exporting ATPase
VPETLRLRVAAGCCAACAGDVRGTLAALPGAEDVQVLAGADVITVAHDGRLDEDTVRRAAAQHNLTLVSAREPGQHRESPWWRDRFVLTMAAATVLLAITLVGEYVAGSETVSAVFGVATILVGGAPSARDAVAALRARRLAFVQLLIVAVIGAVILGVVEEAAILVVVYSLGDVLETWLAHRARRSLRSLMELVPSTARRRTAAGDEELVAVDALAVGDLVLVRPGERLPTDGIVHSGVSAVDQSAVTGESIPVEVTPGGEVFGGTVNGIGALEVEASRPYEDTTLARVIRQIEDAQANKGTAQRFADRFGARYTPAVAAIALAVVIIGPLAGGELRSWVYRALVVLVVSCSCALIISVPTAIVAAVTRGARDGILIRGGAFLEALAAVRTVAFDKTGTLTQGHPRLTDVVALNGLAERDVLTLAASVEAASEHPLAGAVLAGARARGLDWPAATDARAEPGVGVHARLGSLRLFVGRPDATSAAADGPVRALAAAGKTVMVITRDAEPVGLLAVADELRAPSREVVEDLHSLGVERVVMLTGDHDQVARAIAGAAGVDDVRAKLLAQDKSAAVAELAKERGPVAMVGDGINDAPALAVADVGIAMGASGTTVALETADVALMADELDKLPTAIRLARRAMRVVHQNVALSLVAVVALVTAALAGQLTLTEGLLLNEGTALLIIANGLRLLRGSQPRRNA